MKVLLKSFLIFFLTALDIQASFLKEEKEVTNSIQQKKPCISKKIDKVSTDNFNKIQSDSIQVLSQEIKNQPSGHKKLNLYCKETLEENLERNLFKNKKDKHHKKLKRSLYSLKRSYHEALSQEKFEGPSPKKVRFY